jgi:hypothetical protein
MAFQVVDASLRTQTRSSSKEPEVSFYGKVAQFRLNTAAMALMTEANGGADVVKILVQHDAETNRLAFSPVAEDNVSGVRLSRDNPKSGSRYFGFRTLALSLGLDFTTRWTVPMTYSKAEKVYVISLDDRREAPIEARVRRTRAEIEAAERGAGSEAATPTEEVAA